MSNITRWCRKILIIYIFCFSGNLNLVWGQPETKLNVIFIIIDDLNDLPYQPDGKPLVPTPNIDRLKAQGVTFTNAHTNNPLCAPSRASMMFGIYPQTSSLYWFEDWRDNGVYRESISLNQNLRNGGYKVFGTGKIYHGNQDGLFDEFGHKGNIGPFPWDGKSLNGMLPHPQQLFLYDGEDADMDYKWEHVFGPLSNIPIWPADKTKGIPGYSGWRLAGKPWRYINDEDRDLMPDELSADWTSEIIARKHDEKPFALFTGLVRTHTPLYAPKKYFDRFPIDSIELPKIDVNDLNDVSTALGNESLYGFRRYKMLVRHEGKDLFRKWLQAYMACVAFVDDQVGKILDSIESSPFSENTIVFLTSDHGFHMGEKNFLYKGSLWEPSTRVPLIIAGVPGSPKGKTSNQPVSLVDIYPTFNELFRLDSNPNSETNKYELEGHSLVPIIMDPENGNWEGPDVAITSIPGKNHSQHKIYDGSLFPHFSVRDKRWRYSLTSNGGEELYDHKNDPFEWVNLSNDPDYLFIKNIMKEQLIELRDGDRWQSLHFYDSSISNSGSSEIENKNGGVYLADKTESQISTIELFKNFEFESYIKVDSLIQLSVNYGKLSEESIVSPKINSNEARLTGFHFGEWNHYRIRVHNSRHQLWINKKYVSDLVKENSVSLGPIIIKKLTKDASLKVLQPRVRKL